MRRAARAVLVVGGVGLAGLVGLGLWYRQQDPCDHSVEYLADSERYVGHWVPWDDAENHRDMQDLLPGVTELDVELVEHVSPGVARIRLSSGEGWTEATMTDYPQAEFVSDLALPVRPPFLGPAVATEGVRLEVRRCLFLTWTDRLVLWLDSGGKHADYVTFQRAGFP